jgi:hypothetical protein
MAEASLSHVAQLLESWFASLMAGGQNDAIVQSLNDPGSALQSLGISQDQLSQLDLGQIYQNACNYPGVPQQYQTAAQPYVSTHPSVEQVVQQIKYVNDIHQTFDDHSTNVDNSNHFEGDVHVEGDFTFDPTNVTATSGGVAGGETAVGATGAGSAAALDGQAAASGGTVIGGDNLGIANSPGAVQAGVTNLTGDFGGGTGGGEPGLLSVLDPHPPSAIYNINTGGDQQVANQLGGDHPMANFGSGQIQNLDHNTLENSAVGGGETHNIGGNTVDGGSALAGDGGSAQGSYSYTDSHDVTNYTETHDVSLTNNAPDSVLQGGIADDGSHLEQHADASHALPEIHPI